MTLLSIIQDACDEVGFDAPSYVVGNSDLTAKQMLALANRAGKTLAQRFSWEALNREFTHVSLAAELQGTVESIMPGFNWDVYRTIWNRDGGLPYDGPLYPSEWQAMKGVGVAGPFPDYRIRNKGLYLLPAPAAGLSLAGEYISRYWCQSAAGTDQERWAADDDIGVLSEDLMSADLKWRLLRSKGMDYAEEKLEAEVLINNAMSRDGSNRAMNLEGCVAARDRGYLGGVIVPDGNWQL